MDNATERLASQEKENSLNIYINKVLGKWWLFVVSFIVLMLVAFAVVKFSTPMYSITSEVLIVDQSTNSGPGGGLTGAGMLGDLNGLFDLKSNVDNEVLVLNARMLLEDVVRSMKLNVTYFGRETIGTRELYRAPFTVNQINVSDSAKFTGFEITLNHKGGFALDYTDNNTHDKISRNYGFGQPISIAQLGIISIDKNEFTDLTKRRNFAFTIGSVDKAVTDLNNNIIVAVPGKTTTVINISLNAAVPKKGEDILNKLIDVYQKANIDSKNEIADSTISFINRELGYVGSELGTIEGKIQDFKQNSKLADIPEQSKILVNNASVSLDEISKINTQIMITEDLQKYMQDDSHGERVVPASLLPNDQVFTGLIERYNGLLIDRDKLSLSSTTNNPYVKNLDGQIKATKNDMLATLDNSVRSLKISRDQLSKTKGQLEEQIHNVPAIERTFLDLDRQQQIKQQLYLYLLQKKRRNSNFKNIKLLQLKGYRCTQISFTAIFT